MNPDFSCKREGRGFYVLRNHGLPLFPKFLGGEK